MPVENNVTGGFERFPTFVFALCVSVSVCAGASVCAQIHTDTSGRRVIYPCVIKAAESTLRRAVNSTAVTPNDRPGSNTLINGKTL